jgi:hypothetical protein
MQAARVKGKYRQIIDIPPIKAISKFVIVDAKIVQIFQRA